MSNTTNPWRFSGLGESENRFYINKARWGVAAAGEPSTVNQLHWYDSQSERDKAFIEEFPAIASAMSAELQELVISKDLEGMPRFGIFSAKHETVIHWPFESTCGRFNVNPKDEYGMTDASVEVLKNTNLLLRDLRSDDAESPVLALRILLLLKSDLEAKGYTVKDEVSPLTKVD
jgi:hypothetical protein